MELDQDVVTPQPQTATPIEKEEVKNPEAVLAKNKELLAKLKALSEEKTQLENFKKELEQKELEKKGEYSQLLETLRQENKTLKEENANTKKSYAYSKFEEQIKTAALKEGCTNPDKLLRLMTREQMESVEIDDKFNVNAEDLGRLMSKLKEEHSDIQLFKAKDFNHTPANITKTRTEKKTLADMSKNEIEQLLRQLN